ncbi:MAG: SDR family oxidoreductase [Alphaproteobacteria bacterium]|nr:SDR family oxidoreductase [Alphaproteobacteria bacterium]
MGISGRTALITGGSQGIGAAIAHRLATEGVTIGVVASADLAKAQTVAAELPGGAARAFAADVRDPTAVAALIAEAETVLGGIDILINGAGVFYPTPAGATDEAAYDRMMDINVKGTWAAINAVAPLMKARHRGWIVNFGSVVASMAFGGYAVYCASKAAIVMMTRALAIELAPHGIQVNCLSPGNTATPMNLDIRTKPELKPMLDAMAARTPTGVTHSSAEDMANIVAFMLSDGARAIHGANILADEGFSAGM